MNIPKTHTVCVVGAPADVAARINTLLDQQRTHLDVRWRQGDHASADLLVIDADSVYGHMDWLKATSSGRLIAAYTKSPESYESYLSLRQPVIAADLVALLNRVGAQLSGAADTANPIPPVEAKAQDANNTTQSQIRTSAEAVALVAALRAASESDAPKSEPAAPKPAAPKIETPQPTAATHAPAPPAAPAQTPARRGIQLQDLLELDAPLKGKLRLSADGLPTLLLDPGERMWHSPSSLKALSTWCTRALTADDVHHADDLDFAKEVETMPGHPYARLQWLIHLVRGEGQLAPKLDAKARYKLSRWPQSEREFPKHFRIATIMLKQAGTLDEIAELSGATTADVANFINAYHALGYIEQEKMDNMPEDARRGGLFGMGRKTSSN